MSWQFRWLRLLCLNLFLVTGAVLAETSGAESDYVGSQRCSSCHADQYASWRQSHHDLAMAEPGPDTVKGNFSGTQFSAHGVTSSFIHQEKNYVVRTDGADGKLHDFPVRYTFGIFPLQQYLLELPGGRLQALSVAWDSRAKDSGGQRWYHLYPETSRIDHAHPLHWTGAEQNWNYQCADCHSTGLQKNYDPQARTFATTWAEIDVACESCHGPGKDHLAWAQGNKPAVANKGLPVQLPRRDAKNWMFNSAAGIPQRTTALKSRAEVDVCARCHSRRSRIWPTDDMGAPLLDSHQPALLQADLYFADGQIKDEVYEYGSFLQSRMYAAGVTCSDCHNSHSLKLRAEGNALCTTCHDAQRYDQKKHHQHVSGNIGAQCTACHMPQRTYMGVDERADHSLRVPRPDLTIALGSPNACNGCHADQTAEWAQAKVQQWYPASKKRGPHFGHALHAAHTGAVDAPARLLALANDSGKPAIVRATALAELAALPVPVDSDVVTRALQDSDALVRHAGLRYLASAPPQQLVALGWPLLEDPVRAVRTEAARVLASLLQQQLPAAHRQYLLARITEYEQTQQANAERPESQLNLGLIAAAQGKTQQAESAYREALRLRADFAPAYVNLADLYRATGDDARGEALLLQGIKAAPDVADLHHALGLLYVRAQRLPQAVSQLQQASALAPDNIHYLYVYALVQDRAGDRAQATALLQQVLQRQPAHRDAALALIGHYRSAGNQAGARAVLEQIRPYYPDDPDLIELERLL